MAKKAAGFFIGQAIGQGWEAWKRQPLNLVGVTVAALVTPYIPGAIGMALGDQAGWLTIVLLLLTFLLSILVSLGLVRVSLAAQAGEKVELLDLYRDSRLLGRFLLASLLYSLIVFGGLLLFVIPGVVWAIKFQYYPFLVLEGRAPLEALRGSARLTQGKKWDLLAFQFALSLVMLLGSLALGFGILISAPIALVANAGVYRKLARA